MSYVIFALVFLWTAFMIFNMSVAHAKHKATNPWTILFMLAGLLYLIKEVL